MEEGQVNRYRRFYRRELIIFLVIVVVVTAYSLRNNVTAVTLEVDENSVTLTGPDDAPFSVKVLFQDILSISEREELDAGTNLSGVDTDKCWFGTWENEEFGEYTLCASPSVSCFIVFETIDGYVVWNYESRNATDSLYAAILEQV